MSTEAEKSAALEQGPIIILRQLNSGGGGNINDNCIPLLPPIPECNADSEPLVIDLGQDGIHLGQSGSGIYYDFFGDNVLRPAQWVAKDGNDAFLALDKNQNGKIDNGAELFGRGWLVNSSQRAQHGFEELAQYDQIALGGNQDGLISDKDNIWSALVLWLDINADGVSTPNEIQSLSSNDINELPINPKENARRDSAGNHLRFWAWAYSNDKKANQKYKMVDVFFNSLGPPIIIGN